MHWLKLECKLLFSGIAAKLGLAILLVCSVMAIHLGAQNHQLVQQDQAAAKQRFEAQLEEFKQREQLPSAGHMGYYAFAPTDWQLSGWSALFVGQSQSAYAAMPVRALALQGQIHNREMVNPSWQKAGRLDLGFVLIYLLPMMLGILSVTLLSEERQANRWRMLNALAKGGQQLIWRRLTLITTIVLLLGWSIILLAAVWLSLPFDSKLLWLLFALTVYLQFWALVIAAIISFNKDSVFNTLSFMSAWLLLTVLIPAAIQLHLNHKYSEHPALHATLEQRMVMNNGWDEDQQAAMQQFLTHYPQYQSYQLPPGSGSWEWYYAQQHLSDEAVSHFWQAHLQQIQDRQDSLSTLSWLSPSLMFQQAVNRLAGSGGQQHASYRSQVADYHRQIREYLYRYLFTEKEVTQAAIGSYPRFQPPTIQSGLSFWKLLTVLLVQVLLLYPVYRRGRGFGGVD